MEFKVGDKVKIIKNCSFVFVQEENGALGMVGIITQLYLKYVRVKSSQFCYSDWCFDYDAIELVKDNQSNVSVSSQVSFCPRCKDVKMIKKNTEQYGIIDKCPNCNYC